MKKIFTAVLLSLFLSTAAFAAGPGTARLNSLLEAEYPGASNISFKESHGFSTVNFTWNNQQMQAFYDQEGNKIGTSRNMRFIDLPLHAQQVIEHKFKEYAITETIEFEYPEDGISYYVSLKKDTQKLVMQVSTQGDVSLFKKIAIQ